MPVTLRGGRIELSGWYVALLATWLLAGLPFVLIIGIGMGGLLAFFIWFALNAVLFAPIMLAPYGVRRKGA